MYNSTIQYISFQKWSGKYNAPYLFSVLGKPKAGQFEHRGELPSDENPRNQLEEDNQIKHSLPDLPILPDLPVSQSSRDLYDVTTCEEDRKIGILKRPDDESVPTQTKPKPMPLHERLTRYYETRSRIFNTNPSKRILKLRERFKKKTDVHKAIAATCLCKSDDIRPYAPVDILAKICADYWTLVPA